MLTYLTMLFQKIEGANYIAALVACVWVLYAALFLVIRPNRGVRQIKWAAILGLGATFVCDVIWFFKYFDNFVYLNPGIGGMLWLCLLPGVMLLLVMVQSYFNTGRYEHERKKEAKEQEKLRKKESRRAKFEHAEDPASPEPKE